MESGEEIFGSVYEKGSVIFREGEPGKVMYIIQSGAVEVSKKRGDEDYVLAILQKGDFFGEMALLQDDLHSATVTAIERTRLLPLTRESLISRLKKDPGVTFQLLKKLVFRLHRSQDRIKNLEEDPDEYDFSDVSEKVFNNSEAFVPASTIFSYLSSPESGIAEAGKVTQAVQQPEKDVTFKQLAGIWNVAENLVTFPAGATIFSEREPAETMFIIIEGEVEIFKGNGIDRHFLTSRGPGDLLGEMAIISESPRSASVFAVGETKLLPIRKEDFSNRIKEKPELALFIIQSMITKLRTQQISGETNERKYDRHQSWSPLLKKENPVRIAIVSLSTCAGCTSVLLDEQVLAKISERAEIIYCPMLMDQLEWEKADIALIDGAVRLKEDEEKLYEARRNSRFVVAWGTCGAFAGIPAEANQYELEELIEATYGEADDAFAYYLSGKGGVEAGESYQEAEVALLRQAYRLDNFVKVDYYIPGCPPQPNALLQLLRELSGESVQKTSPIVCVDCGRKAAQIQVDTLRAFPLPDQGQACFISQGVLCVGFMTRGGCGGPCPRNGLPCWGCRGPSEVSFKKMLEGESFDELLIRGVGQRCKMDEIKVRSLLKPIRRQGHCSFYFQAVGKNKFSRFK